MFNKVMAGQRSTMIDVLVLGLVDSGAWSPFSDLKKEGRKVKAREAMTMR
jgi:hypothetical protein